MPEYPYLCPEGHRFDLIRSMAEEVGSAACPRCGARARQDFSRKTTQTGMVDGAFSGYFPRETGFRVDPQNQHKRICPNKRAFDEFQKKVNRGLIPGMGPS